MVVHLLFYFYIGVCLVYLLFDFYFGSLNTSHPSLSKPTTKVEGVSVIIAAKNEYPNLKQHLEKILQQHFSLFEVIVINDHSTDESADWLKKTAEKHTHFSYFNLNDSLPNKKRALAFGIQQAAYENLVFTDADCMPISKNWLAYYTEKFEQNNLILGYSAYQKKPTWLNKIIRYETLQTAFQYFSAAQTNQAYMGVGRNLGYKKSLFQQVNGFKNHQHIKSGDDDLLIQAARKKASIACLLHPESFTYSLPQQTWRDYVRQKRRHITTAQHYSLIHQLLLGSLFVFRFLFWLLTLLLLFTPFSLYILLILLNIWAIKILAHQRLYKHFNEKDLLIWSPLLEFQLTCFQLYIALFNIIQKPKNW
ncbi:MAG: glycosyltransferase [Bacteroidota bacterium]